MNRWFFCCLLAFAPIAASAEEGTPQTVLCLLDENAAELLPKLTNPGGDGGLGEIESSTVFSGEQAVKITILQRYCNFIEGWAHRIREAPKVGEYRYLRFAWKADGLGGIMLQLHDDKDWNIRYVAGANLYGWTSQTVAEQAPSDWTLVTIDLFKDFGERELHGIALTVFSGNAGYFDHVYLGNSIEALDAIDALAIGGDSPRAKPLALSETEVETYLGDLTSADASLAYRAFWTLAAGDESVRALLLSRLAGAAPQVDGEQVDLWISQLDHDDFTTREDATAELLAHLSQARERMETEFARTPSFEARFRLKGLLERGRQSPDAGEQKESKLRRIVALIEQRQAN